VSPASNLSRDCFSHRYVLRTGIEECSGCCDFCLLRPDERGPSYVRDLSGRAVLRDSSWDRFVNRKHSGHVLSLLPDPNAIERRATRRSGALDRRSTPGRCSSHVRHATSETRQTLGFSLSGRLCRAPFRGGPVAGHPGENDPTTRRKTPGCTAPAGGQIEVVLAHGTWNLRSFTKAAEPAKGNSLAWCQRARHSAGAVVDAAFEGECPPPDRAMLNSRRRWCRCWATSLMAT
jgi:hypothetical protein